MEVDSHFPPLTLKKEGFSEWTHLFKSFKSLSHLIDFK